jgi:hypothetical protein
MKTLKNCIKLGSCVKIYVPSTVNVSKEINSQVWQDKAMSLLAECFGGSTSSDALGAWISQSGELIKERVTLVFSYVNSSQLENHIETIYDFCLVMKKELSQEAIALEVNGELYLL